MNSKNTGKFSWFIITGLLCLFVFAGCDLLFPPDNNDNTSDYSPKAPGNFKAQAASENSIVLSWNTEPNSSRYNIYRSGSSGSSYTLIKGGQSETTYTDTGLLPGTTYYYRVTGLKYYSGGDEGPWASAQTATDALGVNPSGLKMTAAASGSITLGWTVATNASSYKIFRSAKANEGFTQIGTSPDATYVDSTVTAGSAYFYKVQALLSEESESRQSTVAYAFAAVYWNLPQHTAKQQINMTGNGKHYYRLLVTAGTSYTIENQDYYGNDGTTVTEPKFHTSRVTAWQNDGTQIFDVGYSNLYANPRTFTATYSGYVTVEVKSVDSQSGNYAIYYFDNGTVSPGDGSGALPPQAPLGVKITTPSSGTIGLSWNSVSGASSYRVFRANTTTSNYVFIGTSGNLSYTDTTVTSGMPYCYKISATGAGGESAKSTAAYSFAANYNDLRYFNAKQQVTMTANGKHYYRLLVTAGTSYTIENQDYYGNDETTVTVPRFHTSRVTAWQNDGTQIFDVGYSNLYANPRTFTATYSGYVTVEVKSVDSQSGNYAIYYYEN